MNIYTRLGGFVFLIGFTGCASVPLMSLPKLARIDVETIDVSKVEVAILTLEGVRLQDDAAMLTLEFEGKITGEKIKGRFVLPQSDEPLTKYLQKRTKTGMKMERYHFDEATSADFHSFRSKLFALKKKNPGKNPISFGVMTRPCITAGTNFADSIPLTVYLRTDPNKKFYKLLKKQNMKFTFKNPEDRKKLICK
ncbi:MAG: hypothetical protein COA43_15800 [Robiginitomaculum sp.]|nr:MAG: hypothetical protein COA43_15800 [Robiginitomaculum sp.]